MNNRPNANPTPPQSPVPHPNWSPGFRGFVSVLLLVHLTALFVGPCASPPPSSMWAREAEAVFEPYLHVAFLKDHGYRFFAPNPGPSHLVRYELLDEADQKIGEGTFPNLDEHWPRLLYHRHFMISESLFNMANISDEPPPPDAHPAVRADYESARDLRNAYLDSISRHLARQYPEAAKIRIVMVQHSIPLPLDVANGRPLSDPELYEEAPLGVYTIQPEDRE
ncbi:hypothetical protein DTL21_14685 [Bremerella cremea]|uniref:Uncharacterized protein n=1 Tax=Blastopirellula marina TaxID=124 RepID=A0A2S8FRD6_9BACT|nr:MULTISPECIES: hypothetical protein [Pirellulaceae]PQO34742.1 hypothetical protein C5Y83_14675 [Blastopirellula marina]RCS47241.1 hypothetical protein DTL21_14685 [Bremerella cremea]